MAEPAASSRSQLTLHRPPPLLSALVALSVIALVAFLHLAPEHSTLLPIAYGMPLLVCLWFRRQLIVWAMVAAFTVISAMQYARMPERDPIFIQSRWAAFLLVELDMVVIAAVLHYLIGMRHALEGRNSLLECSNRERDEREETIATQNEELQAKTEETERQGEELRVTNEELETRERMLEQLLELSHSLTAELTRGQLTARLCDAVASLLNIPGAAAALLERVEDHLRVTACDGFADGLSDEPIPLEASFSALVMDRGQTAYVEDLRRRPDLQLPKPRGGEPMRSVLATPLRVHGKPIGTIEVYCAEPRHWSRKEIALMEALAAQASTSLENLHLFEEIEDQRRRLETIFRTLPVGVMITDASYSDVRMNAAGAAVVGEGIETNFARADAIGGRWWWERGGRALQHNDQPIVRALRQGEEVRGQELELAFADGRRVSLLVAAAPITDRQSRTLGAVCTFVDVTPLTRLQRELEQRRQEAEEASVRKTRFLAAVSHDIRTPANAINLLAELLQRTADQPAMAGEIPEMAAELQASAPSLVNLVGDVLDMTRYDYGKVELQDTEFSLAELIEELLRQLKPLAYAKGLALGTPVVVPTELRLRADRTKLSRVLTNLVGNAIKFTEKGSVAIRALLVPPAGSEAPGEVRLSISDTGVGILPEHLPRIFDEFFQIKNPARDRTKGAGLGLAICKRLVDAMGGTIAAQGEPGIGMTFTVTLPATRVVS